MESINWGHLEMSGKELTLTHNGRFIFHIEKTGSEILVGTGTSRDDCEISRYVAGLEPRLSIAPALPELPMVIKPSTPVSVLPGIHFDCVVAVPLVFQLICGTNKKNHLLVETVRQSLSRSWFGDPWNGEAAFFQESPLHVRDAEYGDGEPVVFCPVTITNKSNQILELERMILRVPYLSIYEGRSKLYSNRTRITFRGQDKVSQISLQKGAPDQGEPLKAAGHPRRVDDASLLNKSFYFIKTIYNG